MKRGLLCLLLPVCSCLDSFGEPDSYEHALTWYCVSPEGCERTDEVARIDRATITDYYYLDLASTQDPSYSEQGEQLTLDSLPVGCAWIYYLSLFGHDLDRSMLCYTPGGFELHLSIPDPDPATFSMWVASGRKLSLL